jgi:hypothetical protein
MMCYNAVWWEQSQELWLHKLDGEWGHIEIEKFTIGPDDFGVLLRHENTDEAWGCSSVG